jgi:hypothetical protein
VRTEHNPDKGLGNNCTMYVKTNTNATTVPPPNTKPKHTQQNTSIVLCSNCIPDKVGINQKGVNKKLRSHKKDINANKPDDVQPKM